MFWQFWAAVPPDWGMPGWVDDWLSISGLVAFVIVGLSTSRLWTKRQVDELIRQHDREVQDLKDRYEKHISRTIEMWQGRTNDALEREREWRDAARQWEATASMLSHGLEPLQDQGEAMLRIVSAWQAEARRGPREISRD